MIYFDNAATTRVYDETAELTARINNEAYFNPSALYPEAVGIAKSIKEARSNILNALRGDDGAQLYFLSGGTEADNTALFCTKKPKGSRVIVSAGEHDAIINPANELKNQGYDVVAAPINRDGSVNKEEFIKLLNEKVSLVSIMHVSNETGAVNDIGTLCRLTRKYAPNALFHSDGVQAFCKINVNLRALGVDLYTISGHKIHAPKGIGGLYVKKGVSIKPLVYGGGQEKGFRSGTENVAGILAFDDAVKRNLAHFEENNSKKRDIIEYLRKEIISSLPDIVIISSSDAAPHILTVAFARVRGEVLLHALERRGICVGIGSACSSHRESRFKGLLGLDDNHKDGIMRFSVSEFNTVEEAKEVAEAVAIEVNALRKFERK